MIQEFRVFAVFPESNRVWLVNGACKGESVVWRGFIPKQFEYQPVILPKVGDKFDIPVREGFNMPTAMDFACTLHCDEPRMLFPDVSVELTIDAFFPQEQIQLA